MQIDDNDKAVQAIMTLVGQRGPEKSICPSEAARQLAGEEWRGVLKRVRRTAIDLARDGRIVILKKGKVVPDPATVKGVIRLSLPRD